MSEDEDLCARFAQDLRAELGGRARAVAETQRAAATGEVAASWARVIEQLDRSERRVATGRKLSLFRSTADRV